MSPGIVTADGIIENDLDSKPVTGERSDQYGERFLHGELFKARPDVMAIVHSHTPELVAFSVSSVPLAGGDAVVPIFDIRKVNNGQSGILSTPALGQSFAESVGKSDDDPDAGPRRGRRRRFNLQRRQQRERPAHGRADPAATDFDGRDVGCQSAEGDAPSAAARGTQPAQPAAQADPERDWRRGGRRSRLGVLEAAGDARHRRTRKRFRRRRHEPPS